MADLPAMTAYNTNKHPITIADGSVQDEETKAVSLLNKRVITPVPGRMAVFLNNRLGNKVQYRVKINPDFSLPCSVGTPYDAIEGLPSDEDLKHFDAIFGNFVTASEINRATGKLVIGPNTNSGSIKDKDNNLLGVSSLVLYPALMFTHGILSQWSDVVVHESQESHLKKASLIVSAQTPFFYDGKSNINLSALPESFAFPQQQQISLDSTGNSRMVKYNLKVDGESFQVDVLESGPYNLVKNVPTGCRNKVVFVPENVALTIVQNRPDLLSEMCIISGNGNEGAYRNEKNFLVGYKSFKLWSKMEDFPHLIEKIEEEDDTMKD